MSIRIWSRVILLLLCLVGQTQGFPLHALSRVAQLELPSCPAWKEWDAESTKVAYDGHSLSSLQYDAELPPSAKPWLADPIGVVRNTFVYDSYPIATIRAAGPPRAPPVDEGEFLSAKMLSKGERLGMIHERHNGALRGGHGGARTFQKSIRSFVARKSLKLSSMIFSQLAGFVPRLACDYCLSQSASFASPLLLATPRKEKTCHS